MNKPPIIRDAVITFLEIEIVGEWKEEEIISLGKPVTRGNWVRYQNWRENASVRLVRPDEMIREFVFKNEAIIYVSDFAIRFKQEDVKDEHSVDQDTREGKRGNAKVVNPN